MQETQKQEIAGALVRYMEEKGISQGAAATLCGISGANVSHIVNRKWKCAERPNGNVVGDGIFQAVQRALGLRLNVVQTDNYRAIMTALAKAKKEQRCILVDADTGSGKTFVAEEFKRQAAVGTYLVTSTTRLSAEGFMERLAEAVGVDMVRGLGQTKALMLVAEKLMRHDFPLLILDEMETPFDWKHAASIFGLVKDLQRETAGRLGIVMLGAGLWEKLQNKVKRRIGSFPQLVSRFEQVPPVLLAPGVSKEDEAEVAAAFGLASRKELRTMLEAHTDKRPCKNFRDLFGRLEEVQTVNGIVAMQAAA